MNDNITPLYRLDRDYHLAMSVEDWIIGIMSSRPPRSVASMLWDVLRTSVHVFWHSNANPARQLLQRQQALAVLGLSSNATPDQIRRRYRALAKRHHPDRGGDRQQMQRIIAAYGFLMKEHHV